MSQNRGDEILLAVRGEQDKSKCAIISLQIGKSVSCGDLSASERQSTAKLREEIGPRPRLEPDVSPSVMRINEVSIWKAGWYRQQHVGPGSHDGFLCRSVYEQAW